MYKSNSNSSGISGQCLKCGYPVIVTQPDSKRFPDCDYWYYCSNKKCDFHNEGEHTEDMEDPKWVIYFDEDGEYIF